MGPHDVLMSDLIKLLRHLEQYCKEFEPISQSEAIAALQKCMVIVSKFPDEEEVDLDY